MDDTSQLPRRLRAARQYAGMSREEVAKAIDRVEETVARYERGQTEPDSTVIGALAKAMRIPRWFLDAGFNPPADDPDLAEEVEYLKNQMQSVWRELAAILDRDSETPARAARARKLGGTGDPATGHGQARTGDDLV